MRIVLDEKLLSNKSKLSSFLEELYLGSESSYQICVTKGHLDQIESLFDQIISQHGIRPVSFEYLILES